MEFATQRERHSGVLNPSSRAGRGQKRLADRRDHRRRHGRADPATPPSSEGPRYFASTWSSRNFQDVLVLPGVEEHEVDEQAPQRGVGDVADLLVERLELALVGALDLEEVAAAVLTSSAFSMGLMNGMPSAASLSEPMARTDDAHRSNIAWCRASSSPMSWRRNWTHPVDEFSSLACSSMAPASMATCVVRCS